MWKISGQLYPDKMGKKTPGKCVLVNGQWYLPSEVEALGGKKSAKNGNRHSFIWINLFADYDLSCCDDTSQLDTALSSCNVVLPLLTM